jgi:hypothetical protein
MLPGAAGSRRLLGIGHRLTARRGGQGLDGLGGQPTVGWTVPRAGKGRQQAHDTHAYNGGPLASSSQHQEELPTVRLEG